MNKVLKLTNKQLKFVIRRILQETIKKVGNKYVVYPEGGGSRLGTHDTRKDAEDQLAAIHISKNMGEANSLDEEK